MTPERWQRVKDVFDSALDAAPEERAGILDRECGGDTELREEVERLLGQFDEAGSFLNQPLTRAASFAAGDVVAGRYRITALLGRGGMGEVYEAHDLLLKEEIALKTMRIDFTSETLVQRFQREIQVSRKVTHPNVCRVFETGIHTFEDSGRAPVRFFTMELLKGETLSSLIRKSGRFPAGRAFPIAIQLARGLQAAHDAGIVHRDFKSGNVILVPAPGGDRAVITDFGLAGLDPLRIGPDETHSMQAGGHVAGTVAYMSPEQLAGQSITAASDVYSMGIVLFEMATGRLPFDDRHLVQSAMQRASGEGPPVRSLVPDIDPRWESAILRCLRTDPQDRFRSAEEVAAWFGGGSWLKPRLWTRRQWEQRSALVGLPLAAGGSAWFWLTRPYQPAAAARDWYEQGRKALHSMTYESARRKFEQAVDADPRFALAYASLARAYDEMDYTDRAKELMLQAVAAAREWRPSRADELRLRALEYMVSRDYDRAAPLFQQLEEAAPAREKAAAALESGWLGQLREDTEAAAAAYERAVELGPGYAAAKLRLGFILGRRGGRDELALKAFGDAESLYVAASDYEGITQTLWERANLLNRRGRSQEAMPVIERGLSVARTVGNRSQEIRLTLLQAAAFRNLRQPDRAAELARLAIDQATRENMDNLAASGSLELGNSHLLRGETTKAEPIFRQALDVATRGKLRRLEARARFSLASLYEGSRPAEARNLAQAALKFFDQAGSSREVIQLTIVLAGALHQLGEYEDGVRMLRDIRPRAAALGEEGRLRQRLGANLRGMGNWPEALKEYEQAAGPTGTPAGFARWNCAQLYWWLGRLMEARQSLAEVRRSVEKTPNPSLGTALQALEAEIAYGQGQWEAAARFARQGLGTAEPGGELEADLLLIQALVLIRSGRIAQGAEGAGNVVAKLEEANRSGSAASARLAAAQALLEGGDKERSLKLATEALAFFEPRKIWEAVWRGRHVVAQAAGPEPRPAARVALIELETAWGAGPVQRYLERPDIRRLSGGVR
jgi:tetratricopeptide (TPR) repeat protein